MLELIERKAEGKEIAVQPTEEPQPVPDLMAALEASVNAARQNRETGGAARVARTATSKRARALEGEAEAEGQAASRRPRRRPK